MDHLFFGLAQACDQVNPCLVTAKYLYRIGYAPPEKVPPVGAANPGPPVPGKQFFRCRIDGNALPVGAR
jgi:hypothetical protein